MKKRFCALAMSAVMTVSTVAASMTTLAVDVSDTISGDLTVEEFFSKKTNAVTLKSNDSYTFKFKNTGTLEEKQDKTGYIDWNNYIMVVTGAIGEEYTGFEQEVLIVRADAWGWGGGMSDFVDPAGEGKDANRLFFENDINFDTWAEEMAAGADCEVTIERDENKLSYFAKIGKYTVILNAVSGKTLPETCYVYFSGEKCSLTNITTIKHNNTGNEQTGTDAPNPDDEQTGTDVPNPDDEQTGTDVPNPDDEQTGTDVPNPDDEQTATDVVDSESGDDIHVEYNKNQFEGSIKLTTKELKDEAKEEIDLKKFVKDTSNIPENILFAAYDISLTDENSQVVQPNGKVAVKIACPKEFDAGQCRVYRVNKGSLTNMQAYVDGEYLKFETEHFSTYILTTEDLFASEGFVYGDVNGDGAVTSADAVLLKKYLAEFEDAKEKLDKNAGDVTGDGAVTSADAVRLLKALAEFPDIELGR